MLLPCKQTISLSCYLNLKMKEDKKGKKEKHNSHYIFPKYLVEFDINTGISSHTVSK